MALVGHSGRGKSTLPWLIAGLEEASSGEISIADCPVTRLNPKQRDVRWSLCAVYRQTVRAKMDLSLKLRGENAAEIDGRVK